MKRTDQERMERELRRKQKKDRLNAERRAGANDRGVKAFSEQLYDLLQFDDLQIYNTENDEEVLELLMEMREELPEKQWDTVIRKAVKLTKVSEPGDSVTNLRALLVD